jgi:hypothetical protein
MSVPKIPYDHSAFSLTHPGNATDFFPLGSETSDVGLCVEMARLAYVKFEKLDLRRKVEAAFLPRVRFASSSYMDVGSTQAIVVDGETRDSGAVRVIAFRGTEPDDPRDEIDDLKFPPKSWPGGGKVHSGFAGAFERVMGPTLTAIGGAGSGRKVFVTGHSLGAALATLAASLAPQLRLVTFGSPRVGDTAFTSLVAPGRHIRFVDCLDVVTRLPPDRALNFVHAGGGHFIDRDGTILAELSDTEIMQRQAQAGGVNWTMAELLIRIRLAAKDLGRIPILDLSDHAPINYTSAVLGIRA